MPFGRKQDAAGRTVDFDRVYHDLIRPAIQQADMEPLRADEEMTGGIIHKPMFERLILCEYAVADLTTANANVFYELGIRHAVREWSTVLLFAEGGSQLPFDVALLRALPYKLGPAGTPADVDPMRAALAARLVEARKAHADSPVFQLVEDFPDVQRLKTDVFREQVRYSQQVKDRLAAARTAGREAIRAVEASLGPVVDAESGVVVDLFLSYRAVKAWEDMIALVDRMAPPLAATVMVREQLGLALNRAGRSDEAERVLTAIINERGPSSETYALLGRVYKDRWEAASARGEAFLSRGLLEKAIAAYVKGFEADWRDAYPGINAVTLMELTDPPDPRRTALIPVVRYAVERRIAAGKPDYWDYATLLELAVLGAEEAAAASALGSALANVREPWEPESTARNVRLIRESRERRREPVGWALEVEAELLRKSKAGVRADTP
jgi:tetratricopeptide (TPR) repeat protein